MASHPTRRLPSRPPRRRSEIDTAAGRLARVLYGRAMLLVRVRLFDGPGVVDARNGAPAAEIRTCTADLRTGAARNLSCRG